MSPVKRQKETKLKWILDQLPHGYLIDTRTLKHHNIDRKLAHKYIESGWLEPVVQGLYRRPDVSEHSGTSWQTITRSLQHIMDYSSVVGGRTALEAQGFSHYLKLGSDPVVHLYGDRHPTWLKRLSSKTTYVLHGRGLFVPVRPAWKFCSMPAEALKSNVSSSSLLIDMHLRGANTLTGKRSISEAETEPLYRVANSTQSTGSLYQQTCC